MLKTAAELEAENGDAVAQIRAAAAKAERERVSGILKWNTPQYRAFAHKEIDAAIANPDITADALASQILTLHADRLAQVNGDRTADAVHIPGAGAPNGGEGTPPATTATTTGAAADASVLPDVKAIYDGFNKQAGWGCNR